MLYARYLASICLLFSHGKWFASAIRIEGITAYGEAVYENGPYKFLACDPAQGIQLVDLFTKIGGTLEQEVLPEANKGLASNTFKTFFSGNSADRVTAVLADINQGANMSTTFHQRHPTPPPAVVCLNPNNMELASASARCHDLDDTAYTRKQFQASIIFLCPSFFARDSFYPDYPGHEHCPVLNQTNNGYATLPLGNANIENNRLSAVMRALARFYSTDLGTPWLHINDCIVGAADPNFQLGSASNYGFFAACTCGGPLKNNRWY